MSAAVGPQWIRDLPREVDGGRTSYSLWRGDEVLYVGDTADPRSRMTIHWSQWAEEAGVDRMELDDSINEAGLAIVLQPTTGKHWGQLPDTAKRCVCGAVRMVADPCTACPPPEPKPLARRPKIGPQKRANFDAPAELWDATRARSALAGATAREWVIALLEIEAANPDLQAQVQARVEETR